MLLLTFSFGLENSMFHILKEGGFKLLSFSTSYLTFGLNLTVSPFNRSMKFWESFGKIFLLRKSEIDGILTYFDISDLPSL